MRLIGKGLMFAIAVQIAAPALSGDDRKRGREARVAWFEKHPARK